MLTINLKYYYHLILGFVYVNVKVWILLIITDSKAGAFVLSEWVKTSTATDNFLVLTILLEVYSLCICHIQNYRDIKPSAVTSV